MGAATVRQTAPSKPTVDVVPGSSAPAKKVAPLTIFGLSLGQDTAGIGVGLKHAFDRHTDWPMRYMNKTETYLRYPTDLPYRERLAREFYDAADVVHLHNTLLAHETLDNRQGKPTILHHHGTQFRNFHDTLAAKARKAKAVQLVSTVDLEVLEHDVTWLPSPVDLAAMAALRAEHYRPGDTIRIAHAPTDRKIKSTALVEEVVGRLAEKYPVELLLIEHTPWAKCLRIKATADIFVDQLILGYGSNAIEAWAMGIPVVAGVEDRKVAARMEELWGELPFYRATEETLEKRLESLIKSKDARAEYAAKGLAHVERFHDERKVVDLLKDIYAAAPRSVPGPARRPLQLTAREIRRGVSGTREKAA